MAPNSAHPASVLVTGASTGIGEATAVLLDRLGHRVFAGVRKSVDGDHLRAQASERLTPVLLDVTDGAAIEAAAKTVRDDVGEVGLAGLVNNAGIGLGGPLEYLPVEHWRTQLEVNVIGQVAVTQAMLPMIRDGHGRVVFIGSIGGHLATPLMGPYHASKFAIAAVAESLRHELRAWGIPVVLVEPGAVKTAIWDKGRAQADDLEQHLPAIATERYAKLISSVRRSIDEQDRIGIPARGVAEVIERALFAPRPRLRYLVGRDAKLGGIAARVLPDRLRDRAVRLMTRT
jgi:NAD(P)-dependent dehydrogenase (short-subunit alcohol dehydrogenase family)